MSLKLRNNKLIYIVLTGLLASAAMLIFYLNTLEDDVGNAYSSQNLIRLHVIANSDSVVDQAIKYKVRDAILKKFIPVFKGLESRDGARETVKKNLSEIEKIATGVIEANGKSYPVKAMIGVYNFPTKSYGNFTLASGKYEALKVVIGKGEGANWWCVLFPPLCFVEAPKGIKPESNTVAANQLKIKFYSPSYNKLKEKFFPNIKEAKKLAKTKGERQQDL